MTLSQTAGSFGHRIEVFDRIGSTNDEAMSRARAGESGPLWIVARQQDKGRGRQGRVWVSPPGNVYASLLLIDPAKPAVLPQLAFVAGIALHKAVGRVCGIGAPRLTLKWPNDLLLDGAKLAGILVEATSVPSSGAQAVVIGIGVNVSHNPQTTLYPATNLSESGLAATAESVTEALIGEMVAGLSVWDGGAGFPQVRADWVSRAGGIGGPVLVRRPDGEIRGVLRGIAADGSLLLDDGVQVLSVQAGDIFLSPAAPHEAGAAPATMDSGANR